MTEHFRDKCGGPEGWLDDKTYYTAFTEGWALYAENPLIAQGTNIYKDNLMQKFGMLKWQVGYPSIVHSLIFKVGYSGKLEPTLALGLHFSEKHKSLGSVVQPWWAT